MVTPTPKKPNRLLALITTNAATTIVARKGAMTIRTTATTIMTATMKSVIVAPMIANTGAMIARRAREADRTAAAGLITQSTPSTLLAISALTTPTTPSS
jgi:hypothetical protein